MDNLKKQIEEKHKKIRSKLEQTDLSIEEIELLSQLNEPKTLDGVAETYLLAFGKRIGYNGMLGKIRMFVAYGFLKRIDRPRPRKTLYVLSDKYNEVE